MFTEMQTKDTQVYDIWDSCYGTVTSSSRQGTYLTLDNGEDAFSYGFASLRSGTKVLCSVVHMATVEKRKEVKIESVSHHRDVA